MNKIEIRSFIWLVFASFLLPSFSAHAGQVEDGQAAYERGDFVGALKLLQPLADKGNPEAEYQIGEMYISGAGVKQDALIANQWYDKAADEFLKRAEQGDARAQYMVGQLYASGRGNKKIDHSEVLKWDQKAADQGYTPAQVEVGRIYEVQTGDLVGDYDKTIKHSDIEAMKWFQKAAAQGNADAEFYIGGLYGYDKIQVDKNAEIKQDFSEAEKWMHKAAEDGSTEAQLGVGSEYLEGWNGTKKDGAEAIKWYEKVASRPDRGDVRCDIGNIYETGNSTKQDYVMAYMWYSVCSSEASLKSLKAKMTEQQISDGKKLQQKWLDSHPDVAGWMAAWQKIGNASFKKTEKNHDQ